jgi:hypothetical protein
VKRKIPMRRRQIIETKEFSSNDFSKDYTKEFANEDQSEEEIEECFFGMNFLTNQHPNVDSIGPIAVEHKTIVCLYFSAYWCPPC